MKIKFQQHVSKRLKKIREMRQGMGGSVQRLNLHESAIEATDFETMGPLSGLFFS